MDLEEIKKNWLNREFDVAEFPVTQERILSYVHACGETDPRFCDPDHPDFQAPPTFTAQVGGGRCRPGAFPHLGGCLRDGCGCLLYTSDAADE